MPATQGSDPSVRPWRLLTSHGLVLFYIGVRPDCTIQEISDGLSLTSRTVYGVVGELRSERMVNVRKDGRRHHYSVNYDTIVGHSVVQGGAELRHALRFLISRTLVLLDDDEDEGHKTNLQAQGSQEEMELKQRGACLPLQLR